MALYIFYTFASHLYHYVISNNVHIFSCLLFFLIVGRVLDSLPLSGRVIQFWIDRLFHFVIRSWIGNFLKINFNRNLVDKDATVRFSGDCNSVIIYVEILIIVLAHFVCKKKKKEKIEMFTDRNNAKRGENLIVSRRKDEIY